MARTDRNGKRKGREKFRTRIPDLGYYLIVTDTKETEKNYLTGLRDSLPERLQNRLVIKVSKAKRTDTLVETCKEQVSLAYFGKMHNYQDSVTCCQEFAKTFERKTGQKYDKAEDQIYALLNQWGNEEKAIEIAERRLKQHYRDGIHNPSEMCPCTTLYKLVEEIHKKVETN